jgi:hypothetical protein
MTLDNLKIAIKTYENGYKALERVFHSSLHSNPPLAGSYLISMIVLQSLCCEIGLKALILSEGKNFSQKHKLDKLFALIQTSTQKKIIRESEMQERDFRDKLKQNNNCFVNWRYFFEKSQSVNIDFLNKILNSINSILFTNTQKS